MTHFNTRDDLAGSILPSGTRVETIGEDAILDGGNASYYVRTLEEYGGVPPAVDHPDQILLDGNTVAVKMPAEIFPQGGIIMWSGTIEEIPEGWSFCDGTNGTPDLRDRFVPGTGNLYTVGDTGGSPDVLLPTHTNEFVLEDEHIPAHTHKGGYVCKYFSSPEEFAESEGAQEPRGSVGEQKNEAGHYYSHSSSTGGDQGHKHGIQAIAPGGNNPQYYALAYIMRTGVVGQVLQPVKPEGLLSYIGVSGIVALDARFGAVTVFDVQPNGNVTQLSIINVPTSEEAAYGCAIKLSSDGVSTVDWNASTQFNWANNTVPTFVTDPGAYDWISAFTVTQGAKFDSELSIGDLD
jgi:hypothetical protein